MPRGRSPERFTVEQSIALDLAEPATRVALGPLSACGTWSWSRGEAAVAAIGYEWDPSPLQLQLRFFVSGAPVEQHISFATSRPRYGGERLWFICPRLAAPVRALFLPPGGREFLSRSAHGLVYRSTREYHGAPAALLRFFARHEADTAIAAAMRALAADPDPFGQRAEDRAERANKRRSRRNAIRRLRRRECAASGGLR